MSSLFLIGFMAAGKSQVAQLLASRLSLPVIDLDTQIEKNEKRSISEIFQVEGEAGFRRIEQATLKEIVSSERAVIATGGGTACFAENLALMKTGGLVVHLAVELSTAQKRARAQKSQRPLLEQTDAQIAALYRKRAPLYRQAHLTVSTEGKTPQEVTEAVVRAQAPSQRLPEDLRPSSSTVALGTRSYSVVSKAGCLEGIGTAILGVLPGVKTVGLLSDHNVFALYGKRVSAALESAGLKVVVSCIVPGETSKDITTFSEQCEALIAGGLDRSCAVIALGGGVVGDLAGFVAASLYRGIPVVQVPTSLLAMTDSSLGGKTGINSSLGKNLIGAFWQPSLVWMDPLCLATLPQRECSAAFGELVKYALLDADIWPLVEEVAPTIGKDALVVDAQFTELIARCAALKAAIVSEDERESGLRATLNLGHTVGHAIEKSAGLGSILHGEAVALGLLATCKVSHQLGLCDSKLEGKVRRILENAGLQTDVASYLNEEVLAHMGVDKKRTGSSVHFIVVAEPGDIRRQEIELCELRRLLLTD